MLPHSIQQCMQRGLACVWPDWTRKALQSMFQFVDKAYSAQPREVACYAAPQTPMPGLASTSFPCT